VISIFVIILGFFIFLAGLVALVGFGWGVIIFSYLSVLGGESANPPSDAKSRQKEFDGVHSLSGKLSAVLIMVIGIIVLFYGVSLS
jgi:hypothetical protein